ncbi:MAG: Gfo/Idh/MocA family oxidoreductase [Armatimonadetes bacterium]|nr:Gfo/Idh/MocA family oxidoreductase [Candidatus Hippobium faecium]
MNVGIIGCGGISNFHFGGYEATDAKILWCCDIRLEAAQQKAEKYGAKATADFMDVINDPDVDVINICAMTNSHNKIIKAAAKAGKKIICEKTLGFDMPDSLDICKCVEESKVWFATAYMKRYFSAIKMAKEIIKETEATIISVYARSFQPWSGLFDIKDPEMIKATNKLISGHGGGVLVCGGSHILNLLHYFCGLPKTIMGQMDFPPEGTFDRDANAMIMFENGSVAHFEACWHEYRKAGFENNGWDERFEINTDKGQICFATTLWDHPNNPVQLSYLDAQSGEYTEYRFDVENPFTEEMIELNDRIKSDRLPRIDHWDGYIVDVMIDTITKSAKAGKSLDVEWAPEFLAVKDEHSIGK